MRCDVSYYMFDVLILGFKAILEKKKVLES